MEEEDAKIETIESILKAMGSKRSKLKSQTRFLTAFNMKLELLLDCFKAYSIDENSEKIGISEASKGTDAFPSHGGSKEKEPKRVRVDENTKNTQTNQKETKGGQEADLLNGLFNRKENEKSLAVSLLELIKEKEPISLDDLVKGIKCSKYKVIEVLNVLIKEKIVLKRYEKGFVYTINKENV